MSKSSKSKDPLLRAVVFEDQKTNFERLESTLRNHGERVSCEIQRFMPKKDSTDSSTEVIKAITEPAPASLVVLDWDLTQYTPSVQREFVRGICTEKYIPLCTYHLTIGEHEEFKRLLRWNDDEIAVDSSREHQEIAQLCGSILEGFVKIKDAFATEEGVSLGDTVARILSAPPSVSIQLEQYSWGQQRLVQVLELNERERFVSTAIGYWIYNQILQFPGLLANRVATASYLDIDDAAFSSREDVRNPFDGALYKGPFNELGPFYWIPVLDDIRADQMSEGDTALPSGREILGRSGVEVDRSRCADGHHGAGYYCLATKQPVCRDHSMAPSGWIPIGADLSRIWTDKYDELTAWLKL